jgi:L-aminopeptidase/D-esterase-like protein
MVAAVDVRGGAPGTRETDLLAPGRLVERVDAILLAGGSAFGLAAADGVVRWLFERGRGHPTAVLPVPIVPAAIIFDLDLGRAAWPGPEEGYAACEAARGDFARGCVGAGTGASVGKFLGSERATKSGLGSDAIAGPNGLVVAALVVVNALGNVHDPLGGRVLAGVRGDAGYIEYATAIGGPRPEVRPLEHTTIGVVATNARLERSALQRVAQMAHNGLARAIRPVHTLFDGDALFALASGEVDADQSLVGTLAADAVAAAVVDAVLAATSLAGLPAARDVAWAVSASLQGEASGPAARDAAGASRP